LSRALQSIAYVNPPVFAILHSQRMRGTAALGQEPTFTRFATRRSVDNGTVENLSSRVTRVKRPAR